MSRPVDWNKYKIGENKIHNLNSKFVSLKEKEKRRFNEEFKPFLSGFLSQMKQVDKLFNAIFSDILYTGSYYEGLKVGSPDEFDLNIIIDLPIDYSRIDVKTNRLYPGYVSLQVHPQNFNCLIKSPRWATEYKEMATWFDQTLYIIPHRIRYWLESVVQKTINIRQNCFRAQGCHVYCSNAGPAITLHVRGNLHFDIDLVPVIEMGLYHGLVWPPKPIREKPSVSKHSWYCVPKPVKQHYDDEAVRFWRLSFYDQEKVLINGRDRLKPALRLLKKFRDSQNFPDIASYFLKTVCLWELENEKNSMFRSAPLSYVFVHLLKALKNCFENGKIPYYWDPANNLLTGMNTSRIRDVYNRLTRIIKDIEVYPEKIPNYILSSDEFESFNGFHTQLDELSIAAEGNIGNYNNNVQNDQSWCSIL